MVDKRTIHVYVEFEAKIWRALGTKKNTKVTLRYGTGVALALKSFSGVEIDQNHVDKRILAGKGFAAGRLKRHNFCPASVCPIFLSPCIYPCISKRRHQNHFRYPRIKLHFPQLHPIGGGSSQ